MLILKIFLLFIILILSTYAGILISNKYKNRVIELKELKKSLQLFEAKIRFTCEPIPEIFEQISQNTIQNISNIFKISINKMKHNTASIAWVQAVEETKNNLKPEDLETIKGLSKLLGQTDLQGQINQIQLTNTFLDTQIEKAEIEYTKNEKLYKTLRSNIRNDSSNNINIKRKENKKYGYKFII